MHNAYEEQLNAALLCHDEALQKAKREAKQDADSVINCLKKQIQESANAAQTVSLE